MATSDKPPETDEAMKRLFAKEEAFLSLVHFALIRLRRARWITVRDGLTPRAQDAEDIVMKAVQKVLEGTRTWDPTLEPDLFEFLKSVINSLISHLKGYAETGKTIRETEMLFPNEEIHEETGLSSFPSPDPLPRDIARKKEEEKESEEFFWGFYSFLSDEPDLQRILECYHDDCLMPSDVAAKLGLTSSQVSTARKRLQRRLTRFQEVRKDLTIARKGGRGT